MVHLTEPGLFFVLFCDAFGVETYAASNGWMTDERRTRKDLEGIGRELIEILYHAFTCKDWEKPRKPQSGYKMYRKRFKRSTSWIQVYSTAARPTCSAVGDAKICCTCILAYCLIVSPNSIHFNLPPCVTVMWSPLPSSSEVKTYISPPHGSQFIYGRVTRELSRTRWTEIAS
jgi:hypothetical protein